jgi:hypothetical protein
MIRRIILGAATALLVVGLPVAALGFSQSLDDDSAPSVNPEAVELSQEMELEAQEQIGTPPVDAIQAEAQVQAQERQRVQEHIATGIPEGENPIQEQVRVREQAQTSTLANTGTRAHGRTQTQAGDGEALGVAPADGSGYRHGQSDDAQRGNTGADRSGDCTNDGVCTNDGDCPNA